MSTPWQAAHAASERAPADLVLRIRGLCTEFPSAHGVVQAVRGVDLDIRRGQKIGLVGESGSGKSTLALSILRLVNPPGRVAGGQIWLDGVELTSLGERQMEEVRGNRISLIFQDPMTSLDPIMRIGDQIVEGILRHQRGVGRRQARRQAVDLLRAVEVPSAHQRVDDYAHQLSGGMRQRVMIAMALANDPDLLIADEPTTALDVTTQAQVLTVLQRLVEETGAAVLLITHNLGVVAEFCDRIHVMYAGRVVEESDTEILFSRPSHPYTEALLAAVPNPRRLTRGLMPSIPGSPPNMARLPAGCSFEPRCPVGRGIDRCVHDSPPPVDLNPGGAPVVSECHFALQRWRDTDSAAASG